MIATSMSVESVCSRVVCGGRSIRMLPREKSMCESCVRIDEFSADFASQTCFVFHRIMRPQRIMVA